MLSPIFYGEYLNYFAEKETEMKIQREELRQELAIARYELANVVMESDNAKETLTALHELTMLYAKRASQLNKSKKKQDKKLAKKMKFVADEFYTITMCAIYNKQDQIKED
jgi:ERCC4-type nuclease